MRTHVTYTACTYFDLNIRNLNITQNIWGTFWDLKSAIEYVKKIRRRKTDTLYGAWDIYEEDDTEFNWKFNKIVKHFPPRKDHDFFGKPITNLKIAMVVCN